jgi:NAD(P)-dependent dehydrogenase (short-subunit alcohol dehydrogenase family)
MPRLDHLFSLDRRTALVTGGNSGIGLALARALGLQGARLVLVARREPMLRQAARELTDDRIDTTCITADLAEAEGPDQVAEAVARSNLSIDVIVNAAGVNLRQPFLEVTPEAFDLHMAIHLRAPFRLTQLFAPAMAEHNWGRIINLGSLQSGRAFANSAPYGAAKAGIVQLTRAIAEAWSARGITCNAIAPGFFPTDLTAPVFNDPVRAAANAAQTAIGRNGALPDLYGAVIFFASDASSYVTGQMLYVDGGYSAK